MKYPNDLPSWHGLCPSSSLYDVFSRLRHFFLMLPLPFPKHKSEHTLLRKPPSVAPHHSPPRLSMLGHPSPGDCATNLQIYSSACLQHHHPPPLASLWSLRPVRHAPSAPSGERYPLQPLRVSVLSAGFPRAICLFEERILCVVGEGLERLRTPNCSGWTASSVSFHSSASSCMLLPPLGMPISLCLDARFPGYGQNVCVPPEIMG